MKDGVIVESGSHETLVDLNGEYAKLYKIQANAFSSAEVGHYALVFCMYPPDIILALQKPQA